MARNYRMIMCSGCNRFRFLDGECDKWREYPIESEFFSKLIKDHSKKDLCQDCLQKIKRNTKICKIQIH